VHFFLAFTSAQAYNGFQKEREAMTDRQTFILLAAAIHAPQDVQEQVDNTLAAVVYGLRTKGEALDKCWELLRGHCPDQLFLL
jgi:hypothetical protein